MKFNDKVKVKYKGNEYPALVTAAGEDVHGNKLVSVNIPKSALTSEQVQQLGLVGPCKIVLVPAGDVVSA